MRRITIPGLSIALFAMFFLVSGCSREDNPTQPDLNQVAPATEEYDGQFIDAFEKSVVFDSDDEAMNMRHHRRFLRFLVRYLGLDSTQVEQWKEAGKAYYDCLKSVRESYKNGDIDRKEAFKKMKACHETYIESIKKILTDEQLKKWERLMKWRKWHRRHDRKHDRKDGVTAAEIAYFSTKFFSDYERSVKSPTAEMSNRSEVLSRRFLRFLVKVLRLNEEQQEAVKKFTKEYHGCLKGVFQDIKDGKYDSRKEAFKALLECRKTYMKNIYNILTEKQQERFKRIFRWWGHRG